MASSYTCEATVDLCLFATLGTLGEFSAQNASNVGHSFMFTLPAELISSVLEMIRNSFMG